MDASEQSGAGGTIPCGEAGKAGAGPPPGSGRSAFKASPVALAVSGVLVLAMAAGAWWVIALRTAPPPPPPRSPMPWETRDTPLK